MRKFVVVLTLILALMLASIALAQPPDSDPTCGRGNQPDPEACRGDNGAPGCQGINRARDKNAPQSDPAMDLVTDILGEGSESECD
jgi:hypothetical protein